MSFKSVQSKIASKEGVSKDRAGAILAAATRRSSPAAKKKNPALKKVKMSHGGMVAKGQNGYNHMNPYSC